MLIDEDDVEILARLSLDESQYRQVKYLSKWVDD